MDIRDTVSYFSRQIITDAYTGAQLFTGHFDVFNGTVRDSITGSRRVLTVSPTAIVPPRRCVTHDNDTFIVGEVVSDYVSNERLKKHLIIHPSDGLAELGTSAEMISGTPPTLVHTARSWRKSEKNESESSDLFNIYNFYVSSSENSARNRLIHISGSYYRVHNIEATTGGFTILVASELEASALRSVSYTPAFGAYDPVTDSTPALASFSLSCFVERYQTTYEYLSSSAAKFKPGDLVITAMISDIPNAAPGDSATIDSVEYDLISAVDDGFGSFECHMRPLGV